MRYFLILLLFSTLSCASHRRPILAGEIPVQHELSTKEVEYGAQVYNQLAHHYEHDEDLEHNRRVRRIVLRLSEAAGGKDGGNPWHIYLFKDDNMKNAAATRGNYIFVWSGILKATKSDHELATVLAHEVSHVIADHTTPTPGELVNRIIVGGASDATHTILMGQVDGSIASLAGQLTGLLLEAFLLNPENQRMEMEADTVGLFLMAKAGYNPQAAVDFWTRATEDPAFGASGTFLSSHPASDERLKNLEFHLPEAKNGL